MISTSGHLISKFPEVRFHRTRIFNLSARNTVKVVIRKVICIGKGELKKTQEKAHGQIEARGDYEIEAIKWLSQKN